MAESGVDLTFDNETYDNTGMTSDVASSSAMAHLQPSLASSRRGMSSSSAGGQMKCQKLLRTQQRQVLDKMQAEQQPMRQRSTATSNPALSTVTSLPTYHENSTFSVTHGHVDSMPESVRDVSGQTAPAAFNLLSLPIAAQLWPNSAPDVVTVEPLNPTGSNATSYAEYDEQLNDIVSSIENDICGTPQSSTSYLSASSLPEGSYRGGRKKEPPPPNMTPDQRLAWEQERDKKDKHNDIEKRRRYKINDCIHELGAMLPDTYNSIYREQVNSKGAILEATIEYIHSLRKDQQKMNELMTRVEQLETHERKLLLQRETLRAALVASETAAAKCPTVQVHAVTAAVPQTHVMQSPAVTEHPSSDVVNHDCYMVANDNDASTILDLDAFVLDDVMMTDETEVIDDQLLM